MDTRTILSTSLITFLVIAVIVVFSGITTIQPGERGVQVRLGTALDTPLGEGLAYAFPLTTTIHRVSIKQETIPLKTECFSSDLQPVSLQLNILALVPEQSVVDLFKSYAGNPFTALVFPRVQEAMKEVTALKTAEQIVKQREEIKQSALKIAREKVGNIVTLKDITINNIELSDKLEAAIEKKMIQEQAAAEAKFRKVQVEIEAQTAVEKAKGEAEAIRIQGAALKENHALIELKIVEKWNGVSPLVIGDAKGANILLPLGNAARPNP
ncbi:MAG: prohibitin family protein [Puniceicoccales bacterium]|jgi:prohibitin 2|nr:prohibitin family protein [Puniceicoccales bacterium]